MQVNIHAELSEAEIVRISRQEFKHVSRHMSVIDFHLDVLDDKLNLNGGSSKKLREMYWREIKANKERLIR